MVDFLPVDRGSPERTPSFRFELFPNHTSHFVKQPQLIFAIPGFIEAAGVRGLLQHAMNLSVASALSLMNQFSVPLPQSIADDGQQPATERTSARIVMKVPYRAYDVAHRFLSHVGGVGILQSALQSILIDKRSVDRSE
jgi:hypothetical protein